MIVITIIEQGKMQYRPTLISNLYSHLNKHRLMSIFRDIMALLVSIYRDCIFLISPSTNVHMSVTCGNCQIFGAYKCICGMMDICMDRTYVRTEKLSHCTH